MRKILLMAAVLAMMCPFAEGASLRAAHTQSALRVSDATATLPYELDFSVDPAGAAAKAEGWKVYNFDKNDFKWSVGSEGLTFNLNEYGGKAQDALMSPAFNLSPGEYDFSFSIKGGEEDYPLNIGIYAGDDEPTGVASFVASSTIKLNGSKKTYEEHNLKIEVSTAGVAHFVFFTDKSKRYGYDPYDIVINKISISGQEVEVSSIPYNAGDYSDFTIVNSNGDTEQDGSPTSWQAADGCLKIDSPFPGTDDWAISPALELEAGKVYKVTLAIELEEESSVELYAGQVPAVVAMVNRMGELVSSGEYDFLIKGVDGTESAQQRNVASRLASSMLFMPCGPIAFGLHAPAAGAVATVTSFAVTETTLDDLERRPGNVTDLKAEVNELEALLSWKAPAVDNAREPLVSLDKIEVYRGEELVKTFDSPEVGAAMEFRDAPGEGKFTYKIIPYAGGLQPGEEVASITVALFSTTQMLPFEIDFATGSNVESADALWKMFNFDNDQYEWQVTDNGFSLKLDPAGTKANDAVLSPRFDMKPGRYDVTVRARGGDGYTPIRIGVVADDVIGNSSFDITNLGKFTISNSGSKFKEYSIEAVVEDEGLLRFAFSTDPKFRCDPKPSDLVIQAVSIAAHAELNASLPYSPDDFSEFSIYNVNNDVDWRTNLPITWKQDEEKSLVIESADEADDWAISPLFEFEAGKIYQVVFDAEIEGEGELETAVGGSTHYSDMTVPVRTLRGSRTHKLVLNVEEGTRGESSGRADVVCKLNKKAVTIAPGLWAVGLHAPENGLNAAISHFSIEDYVLEIYPDNVEDLKAETKDADVTLSWVNPSYNSEGEQIANLQKIEVLRNGEIVKTFESPAAGEEMTYNEIVANGTYKYTVMPYLDGNVPDEDCASVIVEVYDMSGIADIDQDDVNDKMFDINGMPVHSEVGRGIYIVRCSDGGVHKIIKK